MDEGAGSEGWCEDSWGMACSVLSSLAMDCGINISLIDPTVLVSNPENLSVKWGIGVIVDQPENPLQPFLIPWPAQPCWPFSKFWPLSLLFGRCIFQVWVYSG